MEVTREDIFNKAAQLLRQEFLELRSVPHAALRGSEAEEIVRRFLRKHLPRRFEVGSGFIIDPRDKVSRQTDVIVYDALNCPVYRASETAGIFPANNVAAVLEVKSSLDSKELKDALDKIASVKALSKHRSPRDGALHLDQTHGAIFAFTSALSLNTIADRYREWISEHGFGHHTDVVCVLDKGIVTLVSELPRHHQGWSVIFLESFGAPEMEGAHLGLGIQELGTATLDVYFRLLLANLSLFRGMVDHPGFAWNQHLPSGMMQVRYLTSVTNEQDPVKRENILKGYAAQVQEQFSKTPKPPHPQ